jgi:autotransporter-associated beta strand protein
MKVDLKRIIRGFRKLLATGAIAAAAWVGGAGTSHAALVMSNGSFESPSIGAGNYGSYFNGGNVTGWTAHNMAPGGGSNGDLNLMTEGCQSTLGQLTGSQYVLAQRATGGDPVQVFSGGVGNTATGLYIDQPMGSLDSTDLTKTFSISADLIRAVGPTGIYYNAPPPTWAGAGVTIGFVNAVTGAVLAQKTISYTQSFPASDTTTPYKATDAVTWNAAGSGLPIGTPINVFVGFRLNPGLGNSFDFNTVAVDNLVLSSGAASSYPTLTWTGTDATHPTQWSTAGGVLNWSNSGSAAAYTQGALVTFDDSAAATAVAVSAADVTPAGVVFNNSAKSYTLQGPFAITGGAYLKVSGGGLVTVSNSNTYTGGTNISNGTLQVGNGGTIGGGDIVINGALIYGRSGSLTTLSTISGGGSVTQQGPGLTVLAGINSYTGATNVSGGTLQIGNGDSATLASTTVNLSNSGAIAFNHSTTVNYAGIISGAGSVIKAGSGTLVLSATNTYSGTTIVNNGKLYATGAVNPSGAITVNSGGLFGGTVTAGAATVNPGGGIEGGYNGAGTLTLASLTYTGSGTFLANNFTNFPASGSVAPLNVTVSGGLNPGAGLVSINLGGTSPTTNTTYHLIHYSGAIGGSGSAAFAIGTAPNAGRCGPTYAVVNNPSYIDVAATITPVIWTGSYSTAWNATDTLPAPKNWTFNGSATNFLANDIVQFDNSTASGGTVNIGSGNVLPAGVVVNNDASHPYTFTGINGIAGGASLTKSGSGTLTIAMANSYSGGTTVNGGTLNLAYNNGAGGTLYDGLTINPGATVVCTVNNALGYGGNNWVRNITINGGDLLTSVTTDNGWGTTIGMTAGTMGTTVANGYFAMGNSPVFNINAASAPSVISANLTDRETGPGIVFNVARGSRAVDLSVTGNILNPGNSQGITINGNGNTVFAGVNTYAGPTAINGGTLQLGDGTSGHDGSIAGTSGVTDNAALVYNLFGNQTASYAISGSGSVTKTGAGKLTLNGGNSYTGVTKVNAGTLYANSAAGDVTVAAGATLGGQSSAGNVTVASGGGIEGGQSGSGSLTLGNLTFNGSGSIVGALSTPAPGTAALVVTGSLTTSGGAGSIAINVTGTSPPNGLYELISYGSLPGGFSAFTISPPQRAYSLVNSSSSNSIDINVNSTNYPIWTGANSQLFTGGNNWKLSSDNSVTDFLSGDACVLDDSATGTTTLNVNANVSPASMTFNNSTKNYTLTGTGAITTGGITKSGSGLLVIGNNNTFSGALTIGGGTVQFGNGGATGSVGGDALIDTGAGNTLVFNRGNILTIPNPINGTGTLVQSGSGMVSLTTEQTQAGGFTGPVNVIAGTLQLNVPGIASSANGGIFKGTNPFYVGPGATLDVAQQRNLRFEQPVTVNAGTLNFSNPLTDFRNYVNTLNLTNAQVTGTIFGTGLSSDSPTWTVSGSSGNTISAQLEIVANSSVSVFTVNVAHDTAGTDLLWTGNIVQFSSGATFVKNGPGKMVYTGVNSYNGPTTVSAGTLQIGNGGASGNLANGNVTTNATLAFSRSDAFPVADAISGSGSVTQLGPGTVYLNGANSYTGGTTVKAGVLGGSGTTGAVTVAAGAGIEGGFAGVGTLTLASLTYSGSGGLNITPLPANVPLIVSGANSLTPSGGVGSVAVNAPAVVVTTGTYPVLQYSGAIQGTGFPAFTLGTMPPGRSATYGLVNNPGEIDLHIVVTPVIWTGSASTAWNQPDTIGLPKNWTFNGSATNFLANDIVQFDNSTASGGTVNISNGNVSPTAVIVNNDASHPYTFTGSNNIAGGSFLTKSGAGTLTLALANSYSGGTTLNAGALSFANGALGTAGNITLNGGTLQWNGSNTQDISSQLVMANSTTATLDTQGNSVAFANAFGGGSSGSLVKVGSGGLTFAAQNTYTGGTTVSGGTLTLTAGGNGVGDILGTLTINPGGTVICGAHDVFGYNSAATTLTTLNINGGLLDKAVNTNVNETLTGVTVNMTGGTWAGTGGYFDLFYNGYGDSNDSVNVLASNKTAFITAQLNLRSVSPVFTVASGTTPSGIDLLVSGPLTGPNGFTKDGAGVMLLTKNSTYSGATTISGGTLQLGDGITGHDGSIAGTSGVTDDAALGYNLAGSQTASYTISGSGSLTKTGSGVLTITGANTYNGGTFVTGGELIATSPSAIEDGSNLYVGSPGSIFAPIIPPAAATAAASSGAVAPVPEPATLAMVLAVIGCAALYRRQRRSACSFRSA